MMLTSSLVGKHIFQAEKVKVIRNLKEYIRNKSKENK